MKLQYISAVFALYVGSASSFTVNSSSQPRQQVKTHYANTADSFYFMNEVEATVDSKPVEIKAPAARPVQKAKPKKPAHSEGVFSPVIYAAKSVIGKDSLNKVRGKVITFHSGVIKDFVDTYETSFGKTISKQLFDSIDKNDDGTIDQKELASALDSLGFTWLKEKQLSKIMQRADKDKNGTIEFDEFTAEIPKTLKTNLVKLAKKNGGDMGLLV